MGSPEPMWGTGGSDTTRVDQWGGQVEEVSGMTFTIPTLATLSTAALWCLASTLMLVDTFGGAGGLAGRWALLVGLAATSSTIARTIRQSRRVVLEVMSWERWMMERGKDGGPGDGGVVRAIR